MFHGNVTRNDVPWKASVISYINYVCYIFYIQVDIKQLLKLHETNLEVIKKYFKRVELHAYKQKNQSPWKRI